MSLYAEYSSFTAKTARYPHILEKPYLALGLCDEAADELLEAYFRNSNADMFLELGDGQWYACRLANAFDFEFAEIVNEAKSLYGTLPRSTSLIDAILRVTMYAGKVAGRVKKHARDSDTWGHEQHAALREKLRLYLVMYVAWSFAVLDGLWRRDPKIGNYDACLTANAAKLGGRLERGTLQGEGDYR